jgi:hypothetical protein
LDKNFNISNLAKAQERREDLNKNFSSAVEYALKNKPDLFLIIEESTRRGSHKISLFTAPSLKAAIALCVMTESISTGGMNEYARGMQALAPSVSSWISLIFFPRFYAEIKKKILGRFIFPDG